MAAASPEAVALPLGSQHFLNFFPLPHGQGSFRPTLILQAAVHPACPPEPESRPPEATEGTPPRPPGRCRSPPPGLFLGIHDPEGSGTRQPRSRPQPDESRLVARADATREGLDGQDRRQSRCCITKPRQPSNRPQAEPCPETGPRRPPLRLCASVGTPPAGHPPGRGSRHPGSAATASEPPACFGSHRGAETQRGNPWGYIVKLPEQGTPASTPLCRCASVVHRRRTLRLTDAGPVMSDCRSRRVPGLRCNRFVRSSSQKQEHDRGGDESRYRDDRKCQGQAPFSSQPPEPPYHPRESAVRSRC